MPCFRLLNLLLEELFLRSIQRDQLDRQLIDLARETKWRLVVVVVHARASIHADIEGLVDRLDERNGVRDRPTGDAYPSLPGTPLPPFAKTRTVASEIQTRPRLPGVGTAERFPSEALHVKKIVHEDWFALEQVETMATASAPERIDHAFCTSLRNFDLGGDGGTPVVWAPCSREDQMIHPSM